jgi:hypothetical protein
VAEAATGSTTKAQSVHRRIALVEGTDLDCKVDGRTVRGSDTKVDERTVRGSDTKVGWTVSTRYYMNKRWEAWREHRIQDVKINTRLCG